MVVTLACALSTLAGENRSAGAIKASLVFRDDFPPERHYPHTLEVSLRLENTSASDLAWATDAVINAEAELLDAVGNPVPQSSGAANVTSGLTSHLLPRGSQVEFRLSHGGISLLENAKHKYALMVGGKGWLVPIETAGAYKLRIRLYGWGGTTLPLQRRTFEPELLFEVPATALAITS